VTILDIATAGDPVLRQVARELTREELAAPETQRLIDDMIETMRAAGGAGLAANQISETVAVAVVEVDNNPRYPYKPPIPLTVIVNPTLEPVGPETVEINEGCLSVPGMRGVLPRFLAVRVSYLDREGHPRSEIKRGLTAGTFQHEVDHLNGIMFMDRVVDPHSFMTWDAFTRFHRDAFIARVADLPR
jgi:peptide deformylase